MGYTEQGLDYIKPKDWDYVNVRDFIYLNSLWENEFKDMNVKDGIKEFGSKLINELQVPIDINPLSPVGSKFFKEVYRQPARTARQQHIIDPE